MRPYKTELELWTRYGTCMPDNLRLSINDISMYGIPPMLGMLTSFPMEQNIVGILYRHMYMGTQCTLYHFTESAKRQPVYITGPYAYTSDDVHENYVRIMCGQDNVFPRYITLAAHKIIDNPYLIPIRFLRNKLELINGRVFFNEYSDDDNLIVFSYDIIQEYKRANKTAKPMSIKWLARSMYYNFNDKLLPEWPFISLDEILKLPVGYFKHERDIVRYIYGFSYNGIIPFDSMAFNAYHNRIARAFVNIPIEPITVNEVIKTKRKNGRLIKLLTSAHTKLMNILDLHPYVTEYVLFDADAFLADTLLFGVDQDGHIRIMFSTGTDRADNAYVSMFIDIVSHANTADIIAIFEALEGKNNNKAVNVMRWFDPDNNA